MRAGKLRHRIVIQEQRVVQNATTGEETKTWVDCFNVVASIEPLSTREFIAAQAQQSEVTGGWSSATRTESLPTCGSSTATKPTVSTGCRPTQSLGLSI